MKEDQELDRSVLATGGEDSPSSLINAGPETGLTNSHKSGAIARPEGEVGAGHAGDGREHTSVEPKKIIRASSRIAICFSALDDDGRKQLYRALERCRKHCATAANVLVRDLQREDEEHLDAFLLEHGRLPKTGKELPFPTRKSWGYQLVRKAVPDLASGIASALSKMASAKYKGIRWDALVRQTERPLRYTTRLPIPIRAQEWARAGRIVMDDQGRYNVVISFTSTSAPDPSLGIDIPLKVKGSHQKRILEHILAYIGGDREDGWKPGELKIEQDSKRPGKWYLRLAYQRLIMPRQGGLCAAFHRGMRNMFVIVTEEGETLFDEGRDVEAYLKQMQRRRKHYQRQSKLSGRSGRGRKRILRPTKPLLEKAARWRRTRAQTAARRAAQWLDARGVTRVYMEDLTGIRHGEPEAPVGGEHVWKRVQEYPLYDHGMRFRNCCDELGIEVVTVDAEYISQRCPECSATSKSHRDLRYWKLRCSRCGFARDLDVAAALNVIARGQAVRAGGKLELDYLDGEPKKKVRRAPRKRAKKR